MRVFVVNSFILAFSALFAASCTTGGKYTYGYYTGKRKAPTHRTVSESRQQKNPTGFHIVNKGDTLYSIAWRYGQDVRDVAEWNGLKPPYTIYPRQRLRVMAPEKPYVKTVHTGKQKKHNSHKVKKTHQTKQKNRNQGGKISWQWPTKGKIISSYSANNAGRQGIDIVGTSGQPVYAAASGKVVYSGEGLRGYGKLIIIKHNDTFFSAYAHNRRLHVREQQKVKKGQHIADMGKSGTDQVMLHFEVRQNGTPVNPVKYLPRRR
jgi:lipoprotein NlpD